MPTDIEQGVLALDAETSQQIQEFNIDALIQELIDIGEGKCLSVYNFEQTISGCNQNIKIQSAALNNNLIGIIQNKLSHELNIISTQCKTQIEQKSKETDEQINEIIANQAASIEQNLRATKFDNQETLDAAIASKKAELKTFKAETIAQYTSTFKMSIDSLIDNITSQKTSIQNAAQNAANQHSNNLNTIISTKANSVGKELTKLLSEGYDINVDAVDLYNNKWLKSLGTNIDSLNNHTINNITNYSLTCDDQTFEQFINLQKTAIYKDQIRILNDILDHNYILPIGALEKLSDLINNTKCSNTQHIIIQLVLNAIQNGGIVLSSPITEKMADILDIHEYTDKALPVLFHYAQKQLLPNSIINKISNIIFNKDYPLISHLNATAALIANIKHGITISDNLIDNYINHLHDQNVNSSALSLIKEYSNKHPTEFFSKHNNKLISTLANDAIDLKIRVDLSNIIKNSLEQEYKLSEENIKQLEDALNRNYSIGEILEFGCIKQKITLQAGTLENIANIFKDQSLDSKIREKFAKILLKLIKNNQSVSDQLVTLLISSMYDTNGAIRKDVNEAIRYLFNDGNREYHLSVKELDKLANNLSSSSNEIRDNVISVIAYYTGKGIITPKTIDAIYGLLATGFIDCAALLSALKTISKEHPRDISQDILGKLAEKGLKHNNLIDLRINALECFYNLSKKIEAPLDSKMLDQLICDIHPAIKSIALRLIKNQFETTDKFDTNLIQNLSSNSINNEELSGRALDILEFVSAQNSIVPDQALDLIIWILFHHNISDIRTRAFNLLEQCTNNQNLNKELTNILQIEKLSHNIIISSDDNTQLETCKNLQNLVQHGTLLTKNAFSNINTLFKRENPQILEVVTEIISYAVNNKQEIPYGIILSLKDCLEKNTNVLGLGKAFFESITSINYCDDEIIKFVEVIFKSSDSSDCNKKYTRLTLQVLTTRGKYLSNDTIDHICLLLTNSISLTNDDQVELYNILTNIIHNGQIYQNNVNIALETGLKSDKQEIYENSVASFKYISSTTDISEAQISLLKSLLGKDISERVEQNIFKIFKNITSRTGHKFAEIELYEVLQDTHNHLNLRDSLSNAIDLLQKVEVASKTIIALLKTYLKYQDPQIVFMSTTCLAIVSSKDDKLNLTNEDIEYISTLINSECPNLEPILKLFKYFTDRENVLSDSVIQKLINQLEFDHVHKHTIINLLDNANNQQRFNSHIHELFILVKTSNLTDYSITPSKLFTLIKAIKTTIVFSGTLNKLQYKHIELALSHDNSRIVLKAYECLEVLLDNNYLLPETFIDTILPTINDNMFINLFKKIALNFSNYNSQVQSKLLNKFNTILEKNSEFAIQQQALDITYILSKLTIPLPAKLLDYVDSKLSNTILQKVALKILKCVAEHGDYRLSDNFYNSLKTLICDKYYRQLEFINRTDIEFSTLSTDELNIYWVLANLEYADFKILEKISEPLHARELLLHDLIIRTGANNLQELEKFNAVFNKFEEKHSNKLSEPKKSNLLLTIINLQNNNRYSLYQVNKILELLIDLPTETLNKFEIQPHNVLDKLEYDWLKLKYPAPISSQELQSLYDKFFKATNWNQEVISKFLEYLSPQINIISLYRFLDFLKAHERGLDEAIILFEQVKDIGQANILETFQDILSKNILKQYLEQSFSIIPLKDNLPLNILNLLDIGWSTVQIKLLTETVLTKIRVQPLAVEEISEATKIIYQYKLKGNLINTDGKNIVNIFKDSAVTDLPLNIHKFAVEQNFHQNLEKDIDTLLEETANTNVDDQELQSLVDQNILKQEIQKIEQAYNSNSSIFNNNMAIKHWSKEDIQKWSSLIQGDLAKSLEHQAELLAVVKRASILDSGHEPRIIQLLSILLMLHTENSGRLVQISTGEGKSIVVAMFAVIKALQGEVVDVITSSPVLARRDAEAGVPFYQMFNFTVKDNGKSDTLDIKEVDCYTKTIVYGSVGNFQGDYLRDVYFGLDIRKGRSFGVVIVDEVDSMLIDEGSHITKLQSQMPEMEYLEQLLSLVWRQLLKIEEHFYYSKERQELLWIKCNFTYDDQGLYLERLDENHEDSIVKVSNRIEYTSFLLREYLKHYIESSEKVFTIPSHLKDFALFQIDKWITSAIYAKHFYKENKHYVVSKGDKHETKIVPIDYANTGILQYSTSWSNGLHQFLEMKHGLRLSPESLTTCFISNMGYFHKYSKNIFGMTGTLGNKDTRELLEDIYPIKLSFIPTYKHKQFIELPGVVASNRLGWCDAVMRNVISEAWKGRAALVICETIANVNLFKNLLVNQGFPEQKINRYARNDNEEQLIVSRTIDSGEIILATNLAGRGTDLRTTTAVEEAGGLHVCLTFLPDNQRVEDQAFGRTARQGKSGTGQLIVDESEVLSKLHYDHNSILDIKLLKNLRNAIEQSKLREIKNKGLYTTLINDELFFSFNKLYQTFKQDKVPLFKLKQLEEKWGLWLHKLDLENEGTNKLTKIIFNNYLNEFNLSSHNIIRGEDSFYYSILHQLKYTNINFDIEDINTLKHLIIKHIGENEHLYPNKLNNIDLFTSNYFDPLNWSDDLFIKAISRIFAVNVILVKDDNSYKNFQRVGAEHTIYIGYITQEGYSSLIKGKSFNDDDLHFKDNILIDKEKVITLGVLSTANDLSLIIDNILTAFKEASNKVAKLKGEERLEEACTAYEQFKQAMLLEYQANRIAHNPAHETRQGNLELLNGNITKAIKNYDKAIELDKIYSFVAHYNKAFTLLAGLQQHSAAKEDLLSAKEQIEEHLIPQLESIQMILVSDSNIEINSDLTNQVTNKINLLKFKLSYINKSLSVISSVEAKNAEVSKAVSSGAISAKKASRFEVKVINQTPLRDLFNDGEVPEDEIHELEGLGLFQLYDTVEEEIKPPPQKSKWGKAFSTVLGIGQIVFGTIIAATGAVAFGAAMITEGVKDLYNSIAGAYNYSFSFEKYFTSKAVSYTASAIMMGWDNFKAGIEAVKSGFTTAASSVKNLFVTTAMQEGVKRELLSEGSKQSFLNTALNVAKKEIPKAVIKVGAEQAIDYAITKASDNIVKHYKSEIEDGVSNKINDLINTALMLEVINKVISVDTLLGGNKHISNFLKEAANILRPEESEFVKAASTIIKAIASKYTVVGAGAITAAEMITSVSRVLSITDRFCSKLLDRCVSFREGLPSNEIIFQKFCHPYLSASEASSCYSKLIAENILTQQGLVTSGKDVSSINDIKFGANPDKYKERIIEYYARVQHVSAMDHGDLREKIKANMEHMIVNRIMHLVSHEIIAPSIHSGMRQLNNAIIHKLQEVSEVALSGVKREQAKNHLAVQFSKQEDFASVSSSNHSTVQDETPASKLNVTEPSDTKYISSSIAKSQELRTRQEEQVKKMLQWQEMIAKLPKTDYEAERYTLSGSIDGPGTKEVKSVPLSKKTMSYLNSLYSSEQHTPSQSQWFETNTGVKHTPWFSEIQQTKFPASFDNDIYAPTEVTKKPQSILGMPDSAVKLMSSGYNYGMIGKEQMRDIDPGQAKMLITGYSAIMGGSLLTSIVRAASISATTSTAAESAALLITRAENVYRPVIKSAVSFLDSSATYTAAGVGATSFSSSAATSTVATFSPWLVNTGFAATGATALYCGMHAAPHVSNWLNSHSLYSTDTHNELRPRYDADASLRNRDYNLDIIGASALFDIKPVLDESQKIYTPVPEPKKPEIIFTPNYRDTWQKLNKVHGGFSPVDTELGKAGLSLTTPIYEAKTKDYMNVTPAHQSHWSDYILFDVAHPDDYISTVKGGDKIDPQKIQYEPSDKHHQNAMGYISKPPTNPKIALENAYRVKNQTSQIIAIDKENEEFVVFNKTCDGVYHGHAEKDFNKLRCEQQNVLRKNNLVKLNGKIKK